MQLVEYNINELLNKWESGERAKFLFFYGDYLSQWYGSPFIDEDGVQFTCCEQYMMFNKAMLFGDEAIADKIMQTSYPRDQKVLGRKVRNFDVGIWADRSFDIVYNGNILKFSQNDSLKQRLLSETANIFVEASPYDKIWGIGKGVNVQEIDDPHCWDGLNMLGFAITKVRDKLM